jgi:hypothetical protein
VEPNLKVDLSDTELPNCEKSWTVKRPPKRVKLRIEVLLPNTTESRIEIFCGPAKLTNPRTETPEPNLAAPRIETALPKLAKSRIDKVLPNRVKLLTETEDPITIHFRMDIFAPNLPAL